VPIAVHYNISQQILFVRNFRLPPRSSWELHSSGLLRSE